jgi:hypothetical protein
MGMIGGTCMQTLILIWVTVRTDWKKEVRTNSIFFIQKIKLIVDFNYILKARSISSFLCENCI